MATDKHKFTYEITMYDAGRVDVFQASLDHVCEGRKDRQPDDVREFDRGSIG
jgi:hypothetical protein